MIKEITYEDIAGNELPYLTHNENMFLIRALQFPVIVDKGVNIPPISPSDYDVYIPGETPSGDWTGKLGSAGWLIIAFNSNWFAYQIKENAIVYVADEDKQYRYNGSGYTDVSTTVDHTLVQNKGTNTHTQIDSHIGSTSNPHSVTIDQITPTTTKGDLLVENGSNVIRLPVGSDGYVLSANSLFSSGLLWINADDLSALPSTFEARLTLESGVAVSTTDQLAKTTLYLTKHKGNKIALYNTVLARWLIYTIDEISIAIPSTINTNYDVFLYDDDGALTLVLVAWHDSTAGASQRTLADPAWGGTTLQDGIRVKDGELNKRFIGCVGTGSVSGQTEKSKSKVLIWNYYNRVATDIGAFESTANWTINVTDWRKLNDSTDARVEIIIGLQEDLIELRVEALFKANVASVNYCVGIGENVINANTAYSNGIGTNILALTVNSYLLAQNSMKKIPAGVGRHFYQAIEKTLTTNTAQVFGDASDTRRTGLFGTFYY